MLVLKNYTADADGEDNFSHFEDKRKLFAAVAIRLHKARSKECQRDKYYSSYSVKKTNFK